MSNDVLVVTTIEISTAYGCMVFLGPGPGGWRADRVPLALIDLRQLWRDNPNVSADTEEAWGLAQLRAGNFVRVASWDEVAAWKRAAGTPTVVYVTEPDDTVPMGFRLREDFRLCRCGAAGDIVSTTTEGIPPELNKQGAARMWVHYTCGRDINTRRGALDTDTGCKAAVRSTGAGETPAVQGRRDAGAPS